MQVYVLTTLTIFLHSFDMVLPRAIASFSPFKLVSLHTVLVPGILHMASRFFPKQQQAMFLFAFTTFRINLSLRVLITLLICSKPSYSLFFCAPSKIYLALSLTISSHQAIFIYFWLESNFPHHKRRKLSIVTLKEFSVLCSMMSSIYHPSCYANSCIHVLFWCVLIQEPTTYSKSSIHLTCLPIHFGLGGMRWIPF